MKRHRFFCIWAFQIGQAPCYQSRDIKSSSPTMPKLSNYCTFISAIIDQCPNSSECANGRILKLEGSSEVSKCGGGKSNSIWMLLLLLLLSRFSRVWLCATPWTEAHQAPLSLGFSRQEHWTELPFPSPMHESEKWKWSCSVVSDS